MRTKHLIQSLVGTAKTVVKEISIEPETNAVIIAARPMKRERCRCGLCHRKSKFYDHGRGIRRWRCSDVGSSKAYIEAEAPRVVCKEHGIVTASVPWARHGARCCKSFEDTVAWLATHTSKVVVSELMRIEWHTVGGICNRVYKEIDIDRFVLGYLEMKQDFQYLSHNGIYLGMMVFNDTNKVPVYNP